MKFSRLFYIVVVVSYFAAFSHGVLFADELVSPDGRYRFSVMSVAGQPHYQIYVDDKPVILESQLGFELANAKSKPNSTTKIIASGETRIRNSWSPLYGERSTVIDHYNTRTYELQSTDKLKLSVEVRCYNQGVAFCYHLVSTGEQKKFEIQSELTQFAFTGNHTTWATETAQGEYKKTTVNDLAKSYDRPQIFHDQKNGFFIAIGEARLVDFARMQLKSRKNNSVAANLSSEVKFAGSIDSPWRFVMVGKSPGELVEDNDLLLNLNDECQIKDTTWIKPGKIIREVTLTSEGAHACIDFAADHGFSYMLIDAGWYGNEYDAASDATTVTIDRKRSQGEIDMAGVIKHGKERGIGVILYVNRRALEKQLDEILPLYKKWGIAGVKYGFVQVGSQKWTTWLHDAVQKAADHQLMVNIHDEYRPTGFSRTFPNLLTQEGIGGDETSPTAKKTLGIFFPRSIAGAGDQTICYYAERVDRLVNHAFQLGKTVCQYSPWQVIYWYDRPPNSPRKEGGAGGGDGVIGNEPELEFFDRVPTVWDETKVLAGAIEEYVVVARRSGDQWWIGAMNGEKPNRFNLKLDFLETEKKFSMRSYTHDETIPTRTKVKIEDAIVDSESELVIDLGSNDGSAYWISPK
jgi:alpha-glucosidase